MTRLLWRLLYWCIYSAENHTGVVDHSNMFLAVVRPKKCQKWCGSHENEISVNVRSSTGSYAVASLIRKTPRRQSLSHPLLHSHDTGGVVCATRRTGASGGGFRSAAGRVSPFVRVPGPDASGLSGSTGTRSAVGSRRWIIWNNDMALMVCMSGERGDEGLWSVFV